MTDETEGRHDPGDHPDFDESIWDGYDGPADFRLDFLDWRSPPNPDQSGVRLMSEVGQSFEAWWDLGFKADPASSAQPVIEVKGLVPPDSIGLQIPWEVEEVGWWIMSRTEPDVAARFGRCGVKGVRRARHWVQSLLEAELAFHTDGLIMMKPRGWLHPDERGWRLIEILAPLGTDATHLDPFYRAVADLTDGRLEAGISLLAAWMSFVNEAPCIGGPVTATLDATHCLLSGLRAGAKRYVRFEDDPGAGD